MAAGETSQDQMDRIGRDGEMEWPRGAAMKITDVAAR
jgi:hypothetical protein